MDIILQRPLVCFDLETTSLDTKLARIVEICCIKCHPDGRQEMLCEQLNPEQPIPADTISIHGITDEAVEFCPTFRDRAHIYWGFFANTDVAGYNVIHYDWPLLNAEWKRAGLYHPVSWQPQLVDPCRIFRWMERRRPRRHDLQSAVRFYLNEELENAHCAETDTLAALRILEAQVERYRDLPGNVASLARYSKRRATPGRSRSPA